MKYFIDLLGSGFVLSGVLLYIYTPPPNLNLQSLQVEGLDGYSINVQKDTFILHLSAVDCLPCRRDTQVLMRYHQHYPDIPIIDANIVQNTEEITQLKKWKKKLDIQYTLGIITSSEPIYEQIPTTIIFFKGESIKIIGALHYENLLEHTHKNR